MDFAFLIHSRDYTDVQRKFKIAKYLPKSWVEFWCLHWPPVVVSKITGLKSQIDNKEITGWLIGIPLTAKQMMENRELAKKRVIQAVKKAEKLGAKIVGLGALTSPVTKGGIDLMDKINVAITTGNALTAGVCIKHLQQIIGGGTIHKISIVGATGSIGQAIIKHLAKKYPDKEYSLFARTKENLDALAEQLREISPQTQTKKFLSDLDGLKESDLIIVATSSPDAFIKSKHLKNGAIIYDITQPQNISIKDIKERADLKVYDGGLVIIPQLEQKLPLGLPRNTVFACLAETTLLALENKNYNFSIGKVESNLIEEISNLAEKYNFTPSPLR